jgi:hypothetical protein
MRDVGRNFWTALHELFTAPLYWNGLQMAALFAVVTVILAILLSAPDG